MPDGLAEWRDLYVMLGSSAAALIGLLFVATSLHLQEIAASKPLRTRSRNLTLHLLLLLLDAMVVLVPQPLPYTGAEIALIGLCGTVLPVRFALWAWSADRTVARAGGFTMTIAIAYFIAYGLAIAGGVLLIRGAPQGLFAVTLCCAVVMVLVIWSAWVLMLGAGPEATLNAGARPHA